MVEKGLTKKQQQEHNNDSEFITTLIKEFLN